MLSQKRNGWFPLVERRQRRSLFQKNLNPFIASCLDRQSKLWHGGCIRIGVNQTNLMNNFESTYALLVRSEEKNRSLLETLVYAIFILSAVFSIWQFAHQPIMLPLKSVNTSAAIACDAIIARS